MNTDTNKLARELLAAQYEGKEGDAAKLIRSGYRWAKNMDGESLDTAPAIRAIEAALATRQPVGQEPVLEVVEGPGEHRPRVTKQLSELPPVGSLLYAAPPAQAVPRDLLRWVQAQADDPNANERFRELALIFWRMGLILC